MTDKNIPFDFVFDYLTPLDITIKPMFGIWAVYLNEKILFILRNRKDFSESNGLWLATSKEHHDDLKKDFPTLTSISNYKVGLRETEWQLLSVDSNDFEVSAIRICELIKRNDHRIGRIPGIMK